MLDIKFVNGKVIFEIPLEKENPVFMCVDEEDYQGDGYKTVVVEADRFLKLWRNDDFHVDVSMGNPQSWRKDYKFKYAEDGFARGVNNPVPLAEVNCR